MKKEQKFKIQGGRELKGEIKVNGAKNSALKILASSVLTDQKIVIENFPFIEDTQRMLELLTELGAQVEKNKQEKQIQIDPSGIKSGNLKGELVKKLRASILLVGPLLARFGKVDMTYPGGCVIGKRPIDIFLDGFEKLGAQIDWNDEGFKVFSNKSKLVGTTIFFPKITVTGTEALMMTAILAKGKTVLKNCAMEPEIKSLADYLNENGAKISGAGTPTIVIEGVESISAGTFRVIPDRIETGTFVIMGLLSKSEIIVKNCIPDHLGALLPVLKKSGANLEVGQNFIKVKKTKSLKAVSISTHEYPGFATDLQPPYTLLMTQAKGISLIHETIFEGRLFFTDQLNTMGAAIVMCDPHRVVISGPTGLYGKTLTSPDLRAGITMVLAGMIAFGETTIENIYQIDRGYENIDERLNSLGASIERVD
jgi:UDP-N-acetylglucosamine 1-carboxyvinyltransferase